MVVGGTGASVGYDRLTSMDDSFLEVESIDTPMHVGALSIFEAGPLLDDSGRFRLAEVREMVASRLHLVPRFRKRLMDVPLGVGRPIWVDHDRFDIAYHVRLTALPRPGSWEQLVTLTTRVQSQLLDRARPLWELWFVEGLEGDRIGLVQKTHHALVDGASGVDVATVLLDFDPAPTALDPPAWEAEPAPSPPKLFADSLLESITQPATMLERAGTLVRTPQRALSRGLDLARSLTSMIGTETVAPRTSLNRAIGRHRRFDVARVPLADAKGIRRAFGGTVNDVVLAAVGHGLAVLLAARDEEVDHVRVMVPVSVRADDDRLALGNRVSAMFLSLPVRGVEPVGRLLAVQRGTADLKEQHQAVGAEFLVGLTRYAAPTLLSLAAQAVHHQPFFNLVVTNVPGPQQPLYAMGARMIEAFPIVPLAHNLTLGVAILSYDGWLDIGVFGDRDTAADLELLAAGIEAGFAELGKYVAEHDDEQDGASA